MIDKIIYYLNEIQDVCRKIACRDLKGDTKRTLLKIFFLRTINHPLWSLSEKTERVLIHFFTDEELWCAVDECQNTTTASKWKKAGWIRLFLNQKRLRFSYMFDRFVCNNCKNKKKIIDFYHRNKTETITKIPSNYEISIVVDEIDDDLINCCKKDNLFYKIRSVV